jgi:hypothetical protein
MPATTLPTIEGLMALKPLQRFTGFGGVSLIINQRSWPKGTSTEAVLDGSAIPDTFTATQDGRHVNNPLGWHKGAEAGEWIYYERYTFENGVLRMAAHGYVDSASRQLLQAG